ncbi:MAG: DUF2752 domain-containing protein [Actinomycetales bacterium]
MAVLAVRDPHQPFSYGFCPFLGVTGLYCPGCGGLRAINDLAHLRVVDALGSNAFAVALVVLFGIGWLGWLAAAAGRPLGLTRHITPAVVWGFVAVVMIFSVFRNTPWGAFLAPV